MIQELTKLEIGGANKEKLTKHVSEFEEWDTDQACEIVKMVKVTKMFSSSTKKLWIAIDELMYRDVSKHEICMRRTYIDALKQAGAKHMQGTALPGGMELKLAEWLDWMNTKSDGPL